MWDLRCNTNIFFEKCKRIQLSLICLRPQGGGGARRSGVPAGFTCDWKYMYILVRTRTFGMYYTNNLYKCDQNQSTRIYIVFGSIDLWQNVLNSHACYSTRNSAQFF